MLLHNKSRGSVSQTEQKTKWSFHFNWIVSLFIASYITNKYFFFCWWGIL